MPHDDPLPPDHALRPGDRIGQALTIVRKVGRGGMGDVYLAKDELLDREVAVKVMRGPADAELASLQTLTEARAAARVVHPHVVGIFAVGHWQGRAYIEMQYVDGATLRDRMDEGPLPRPQAAMWLAQLGAALDAAHDIGVLHCDIKPDNVLLERGPGGAELAKLVDFGLARPAQAAATSAPITHGTLAYLAPELAKQAPKVASDVFSLAVVAHELLTGRLPVRQTWLQAPRPVPPMAGYPALPRAALQVLEAALDGAPELRPPTAGEFVDELLRALQMPELRHGQPQGPAVQAQTTLEVALPLTGLAESAPQLAQLVLAMVAAVPQGYPRAAALAMGGGVPADVIAQLRADQLLQGDADSLALGPLANRDEVLAALPTRSQRLVLTRVAAAIELTGPRGEVAREDASRLYVAGRRLEDAARLAAESADAAKSASARRQHLARAVAFLATPSRPQPWLAALLRQLSWEVACGNLVGAAAPLADAQGLIVDAGIPQDDPRRLQVEVRAAQIRLLGGDPHAALSLAAGVLQRPACPEPWRDGALAVQVATMTAIGQAAQAVALGRANLGRGRPDLAGADLAMATAEAALQAGDVAMADRTAHQALAAAAESGEPLWAVRALTTIGQFALLRGQPQRALRHAEEAQALALPLGSVAATGYVLMLQGQCLSRMNQPLRAALALARADHIFADLGLAAAQSQALNLLAESARQCGDSVAADAVLVERDRLAVRLRTLPKSASLLG